MLPLRTIKTTLTILIASLALSAQAEARTQVVKDKGSDYPVKRGETLDLKKVIASQKGKMMRYTLVFRRKATNKGKALWKYRRKALWEVHVEVGDRSYRMYPHGTFVYNSKKSWKAKRAKYKRYRKKFVIRFPLSLIGRPESFKWSAMVYFTHAHGGLIGDRVPSFDDGHKLFKVGKASPGKPKPLPKWTIRFKGRNGILTMDCGESKTCRGKAEIKKGKTHLIKPKSYAVTPRKKKAVRLRLTPAGVKEMQSGQAQGVLTLTGKSGKKARYTAILKRR